MFNTSLLTKDILLGSLPNEHFESKNIQSELKGMIQENQDLKSIDMDKERVENNFSWAETGQSRKRSYWIKRKDYNSWIWSYYKDPGNQDLESIQMAKLKKK